MKTSPMYSVFVLSLDLSALRSIHIKRAQISLTDFGGYLPLKDTASILHFKYEKVCVCVCTLWELQLSYTDIFFKNFFIMVKYTQVLLFLKQINACFAVIRKT